MKRGHIWVVVVAAVGAALAFFGTDRDELVHSRARLAIEEASVRLDLDRIEQQASLGGYSVVSRVAITEPRHFVLPVEVDQGCAIVASGAWGDLEVASLSATSHAGLRHRARLARYLQLHEPLTQHVVVCHSDAERGSPGEASDEVIQASVLSRRLQEVRAPGGGEIVVFVGEGPVPPIVAGRMVPVEEEIVVREASYGAALVTAQVVFFLLALLGLMAHVALSRGSVSQDGQASLRRLSVALRSSHRASLDPLVVAADHGDLAAARALRDALAAITDDMQAAAWESDRATARRITARLPKLLDALRRRGRRGGAAARDYRSRGTGSVVITLVLQHECELPDFPRAVRRDLLPELFASLLPADKRQLTAVRVLMHPADPSQTLDDAGLAEAFPELQRLDPPRPAKSA